ncbi:MAG: phosphatase PAP2 family protein [Desulfosarcinaceae bacterium]|jgi:membrane-associated phospholipid phosphatase
MSNNTVTGRNLLIASGAMGLALVPVVDRPWTLWLRQHRWIGLSRFMDRTLFEGEWVGGGDPVVILLILTAVGYYLVWKGIFRGRLARWRPYFGFALTCAIISAIQVVHSLKWAIGRARPREVVAQGLAFSHWFEFGPHYITEGIYHGSFPSGHTAQVFLLMALAYILAADPQHSTWSRRLGWCWGVVALAYTLVMGIGRCMTLSHWLSDVVGSLVMGWVGMHLIYYRLLRVPEQIRFHRDWGRHPKTPLVWEMQLCAWSSGIFLGATGFVLALRAVLRSDFWLAAVLAPVGLGLAGFCYRGAAHLLSRVRRCYQVPAPAPRTKGRSQAPALSPESLH